MENRVNCHGIYYEISVATLVIIVFPSRFVRQFKKLKEELTAHLFKLYNDTVFGRKVGRCFAAKSLPISSRLLL